MKNFFKFLFSIATAGFLLILFAFSLGFATFVENAYGVEAARAMVYNSWWLELIMLLLTINMVANFIRFKMYKFQKLTMGVFHLAFILVIIGAGVTRYFGSEGVVHIREGESTNIIVSSEIKFNIAAEYQGKEQRLSESANFTAASGNKFSDEIKFGNKKVVIKSVNYFADAQRSVEADAQGEPIIDLVYAQSGVMHSELLRSGQVITPNGTTIGFNAESAVRFNFKGDSLRLFSKDTISVMDMQGKDALVFPPGKEIACSEKVIYRTTNITIVVKRFLPAAKAVAVAGNGTPTGENALIVQLNDNQKQQLITLWTSSQNETPKYSGTFEGVNYKMWIGPEETVLPFSLKLNDFVLKRYPGSNSPSSYESLITLTDKEQGLNEDHKIFMNNVLKHRGYRFYQSSYDQDERGTILSVNKDIAGTTLTYLGYFFLFLGILLSIFNPRSHFYGLMKRASAGGTLVVLLLLLSGFSASAAEPQPVSPVIAKEFAKVWVQGHDGRIKPFSTVAYEVVMKVSRSENLLGQVPEQVVLGMSMNPIGWQQVEMIAISDDQIEARLGRSGGKASFNDFFDQQGNYKLANDVQIAYGKKPAERKAFDNNVIKVDDRLNVVYQVYHGDMLRVFPSTNRADQTWYAPVGLIPVNFSSDSVFVSNAFPNFISALRSGNQQLSIKSISDIMGYQQKYGSALIPGKTKQQLEILYNHINIFKDLSGWYVLLGFVLLGFFFYSLFTGKALLKKAVNYAVIGLFAGFLAHTTGLIVRGYVAGHMPWSDGYESMIYIAWAGMFAGLIFARRNPMVLAAAAILSGLTLFVAQMSWLNPEITNLVPVLKSYWLTIHVAIITASYGFVGVSAIIGLINLLMTAFQNPENRNRIRLTVDQMTVINEAAMILGLYFLTIGTFLGGIWANESWGRYWGWDPKETWSLVTILLYSFITHMRQIPGFKGWFAFNLAAVIGLLSVLMTYLGVNYYLSGLHSYGSGEGLKFPLVVVVVFALIGVLAYVAWKKENKFKESAKP
ncbi:MAG: cytochrome c biogenesis protein CcsA [Bacteroidia bacterium]|nr:cytochrome c biogenesis protein CcsA [Bacteroidia bacterium]